MKLNILFDIPSKYIEDFCVIASVAVGIFSDGYINWHILSRFFPLVFAISLAMAKTDVKNIFWAVFFSELARHVCPFVGFVSFACYVL